MHFCFVQLEVGETRPTPMLTKFEMNLFRTFPQTQLIVQRCTLSPLVFIADDLFYCFLIHYSDSKLVGSFNKPSTCVSAAYKGKIIMLICQKRMCFGNYLGLWTLKFRFEFLSSWWWFCVSEWRPLAALNVYLLSRQSSYVSVFKHLLATLLHSVFCLDEL